MNKFILTLILTLITSSLSAHATKCMYPSSRSGNPDALQKIWEKLRKCMDTASPMIAYVTHESIECSSLKEGKYLAQYKGTGPVAIYSNGAVLLSQTEDCKAEGDRYTHATLNVHATGFQSNKSYLYCRDFQNSSKLYAGKTPSLDYTKYIHAGDAATKKCWAKAKLTLNNKSQDKRASVSNVKDVPTSHPVYKENKKASSSGTTE